jgi:hypothetical protein
MRKWIQGAVQQWNDFFFTPRSPMPLAVFRIAYGVAVVATLILLRPDWLNWFGVHAWITLPTMQQVEPGTRLNIFTLLPGDAWIDGMFWVFLAAAVLLTVGCFTRISTVVVFVGLASIHQRNLYIVHWGDTFLRLAGYFLIFAPAGAALSVDRWIRVRRGKEPPWIEPRSPWAQRMIQFELAMIYFAGFVSKMQGNTWLNGTALGYVYRLDDLRHFPLPQLLMHPDLLALGSWFALGLEFCLGVLIWVPRLRYPLLAVGFLFHMAIEYSLNIPMFEWDVLSGYILFVESPDLERTGRWVRDRIRGVVGRQAAA